MARTLHRVIEISGFVADTDYADDPSTPPDWDAIQLPPYTDRISWWVVPFDGPDPDTDNQVAASTTTIDAGLLYGDDHAYTRVSAITALEPNTRVADDALPILGEVWVRVSAINTPGGTATHLAIFWEKVR